MCQLSAVLIVVFCVAAVVEYELAIISSSELNLRAVRVGLVWDSEWDCARGISPLGEFLPAPPLNSRDEQRQENAIARSSVFDSSYFSRSLLSPARYTGRPREARARNNNKSLL